MKEQREIRAQRLAFWGSEEEVRAHFADQSGGAGNATGPSDVETALAVLGLKEG